MFLFEVELIRFTCNLFIVCETCFCILCPIFQMFVFVFVGTKMQEIVVSRGKIIELLRPDANTGKVHTLLTMDVFGIVRSLMAFRLTGGTKGI